MLAPAATNATAFLQQHMGGTAVLTGLSLATAAGLSRSRCMRYIMLGATGLSMLIVPWTFILVRPTNKEFGELAATDALAVPAGAEPGQAQSPLDARYHGITQFLNTWERLKGREDNVLL